MNKLFCFCIGSFLLFGCPSSQKETSPKKVNAPIQTTLLPSWEKSTWLHFVEKNPQKLQAFLSQLKQQDGQARTDLIALLTGDWNKPFQKEVHSEKQSSFSHIQRARLHLKRAEIFKELFEFSLQLSEVIYKERLLQSKMLTVGKLSPFYLARIYCFLNRPQEGIKLLNTPSLSSSSVANLVKIWKIACEKPKNWKATLQKLDLSQDTKAREERNLLSLFFSIQRGHSVPSQTPLSFYDAALSGQWINSFQQGNQSFLEEHEKVEKDGIQAHLEHYNPFPFFVWMQYHAKRALLHCKKGDHPFLLYLRGHAFLLSNQKKKAQESFQAFVTAPQKITWKELLFSEVLSPVELKAKAEALLWVLQDVATQKKNLAVLEKNWKAPFPRNVLFINAVFQWNQGSLPVVLEQEGLFQLKKAMEDLHSKFLVEKARYQQSSGKDAGAQILLQYSLDRFWIRGFFEETAQTMLMKQKVDLSTRWLETLHYKDPPYLLGRLNHLKQFVLTIRSYFYAGKPAISTLFCIKNVKEVASFQQLISSISTLRILNRIKGGAGTIKGG